MKKQNILLVLKILETESDVFNQLSQSKIAEIISKVYPCDRKTVGRNIKTLVELGYPIKKSAHGYYLDNKLFTLSERNAVLKTLNETLPFDEKQKQNVITKLTFALDKIYK